MVGVRDFDSRQSKVRFNQVNRTVSPTRPFAIISSFSFRTGEPFFDRDFLTVFAVGLVVFGSSIKPYEQYVLRKNL